jgi:thioredoxin 1
MRAEQSKLPSRPTLTELQRGSLRPSAISIDTNMRKTLSLLALTFGLTATAMSADGPYDEKADAKADIRAALAAAQQARLPLLVVFGANWCADCKMLDTAFKTGASAPLMARSFKIVKVDVGRFDRNVDVADGYGVPLKSGIPAVAVLSPQGRVLYATTGGELADARKMGDAGVHEFFVQVAARHR